MDFAATVFLLLESTFGLLNLFGLCYLGEVTSTSFAMMSDSLFESDWQNLPIELKKYFIMVIKNTQRPIYYDASNFAVLNLKTFSKVWGFYF